MESELFGFEKNAFTGAMARKKGLFEMADGGTVFLDEIGELPYELQSKLLRFLEDQKFKRIGGLDDLEVDVRVLAATNRDLKQAIQERQFREDLFYRLNVFPILMPPLRDRGDDVLLIAINFIENEAKKHAKATPAMSQGVIQCFKRYGWPGNIRELKNVIERTMLLYDTPLLKVEHLPVEIANCEISEYRPESIEIRNENATESKLLQGGFSLEHEVQALEQHYIEAALQLSGNQVSKAADYLGISRFALKRKLEKS
jgi:two-component system response regulator AtoC